MWRAWRVKTARTTRTARTDEEGNLGLTAPDPAVGVDSRASVTPVCWLESCRADFFPL